jgi:hypothetical protein
MKNAIFWDVAPYGYCKNRRFGGNYRFHNQGDGNQQARRNVRLLITAVVVPRSPILVTLTVEAIRSYETSVLKKATRNIPEDGILRSGFLLVLLLSLLTFLPCFFRRSLATPGESPQSSHCRIVSDPSSVYNSMAIHLKMSSVN